MLLSARQALCFNYGGVYSAPVLRCASFQLNFHFPKAICMNVYTSLFFLYVYTHTNLYIYTHVQYIILIESTFSLHLWISEISKTLINILRLNKVLIFLSSIFVIKHNNIMNGSLVYLPPRCLKFQNYLCFWEGKQQKNETVLFLPHFSSCIECLTSEVQVR